MFSVDCPKHGTKVLLGHRSIVALRNTAAGIEVHWRCPCGGEGHLLTGRPSVPCRVTGAPRP